MENAKKENSIKETESEEVAILYSTVKKGISHKVAFENDLKEQ
jgi:hypothetical protein